ncbi:hypothetical protein SJPD1_2290 [Sulfurospirillum diekertiae]|uniref:Uncharacterized protein n=1 Tax=Sulfurospirillum diekertiae TaxID=1854492 RepID=A0A290HX18_9BACT|nr:hypothetical protein [Sulfurospirillum diekertiae]ATB70386.1 hypothetical protein SJPD1_2290 [Sulfurospirillum diekertiae]
MCEAKTLTPLELVGLGADFEELAKYAQNGGYRNVGKSSLRLGIDSIRVTPLKSTIERILSQTGWIKKEVQSHSKISAHAKRKKATKEITSAFYIITHTGFKNILLETPHALNQSSNYTKYKLTIFGLSQPNKPLSNATLEELHSLLKRLEVIELDICIDSTNALNLEALLRAFGIKDPCFTTSYIHNPKGLSYITKLCYYDKQAKDHLKDALYRLELTCTTRGKIGALFVPFDEVKVILNTL